MRHLYSPAKLRKLRIAARMNQDAVALASGVSVRTIRRLEGGSLPRTQTRTLERLYQLYDRRITELRAQAQRLDGRRLPSAQPPLADYTQSKETITQ